VAAVAASASGVAVLILSLTNVVTNCALDTHFIVQLIVQLIVRFITHFALESYDVKQCVQKIQLKRNQS
jgi:hypothetical protein